MGCGGRCGCRRLAWVASAAIANILGTLQKEILPIRRISFIPVLTVSVMVRLSCCAYISRVWSIEHGRGRRDTRGGLVSKVADADEPAKCEWSWCVYDHHGSASLGITWLKCIFQTIPWNYILKMDLLMVEQKSNSRFRLSYIQISSACRNRLQTREMSDKR